jgi:hypothetical protein
MAVTSTNVAPFDRISIIDRSPESAKDGIEDVVERDDVREEAPPVEAVVVPVSEAPTPVLSRRSSSFRGPPPLSESSGDLERSPAMPFRAGDRPSQPDMREYSDALIEEKVSAFARKVVTLLAENAKAEMSSQAAELRKIVDQVMTMIELKVDRDFVERMFNKVRVVLSDVNEKIENVQCSFLEWVTRDELEAVLQKFAGLVGEVQDSAAATAKYGCLLCGRKRSHVAGMMVSGEIPHATIPPCSRPKTAVPMGKQRKPKVEPMPGGIEPDVGPTQKARGVVEFLTLA